MSDIDSERLPDRFWDKVTPEPNTGCWLWMAALGKTGGYGQFKWNGQMRYAHVVCFEALVQKKPAKMDLDHKCRQRSCVNPAHLEIVTRRENCRRGETGKRSGAQKKQKTHCPKGHSYSDAYTSKGFRECRTCALVRAQKQREALHV